MKKQIIFIIMLLLPLVAKADASGKCGENLTWTYTTADQTLTISGVGEMKNYNNDYHSGNTPPWMPSGGKIVKIIINEGVTTIGSNAFYGCSAITLIEIPNSVTSIGDGAFSRCI